MAVTARLTTNQFIARARKIHGRRYDYSRTKCIASTKPLTINCRIHGRFSQLAHNHLRGQGCRQCASIARSKKQLKYSIRDAIQVAKTRNGRCLSAAAEYKNVVTSIRWRCAEGHEFSNSLSQILAGYWCPQCSTGIGERICRAYFEQLFGHRFIRLRPTWLRSRIGTKMELDGYCRELRLAFEHQGEHHFSSDAHYLWRHRAHFDKVHSRDKLKRLLCAKQGVRLIEVPEIGSRLPLSELRGHIKAQCLKKRVPLPRGFDSKKINLSGVYTNERKVEILRRAKAVGLKLESPELLGVKVPVLWRCKNNHVTEKAPEYIQWGFGCSKCTRFSPTVTAEDRLERLAELKHFGKKLKLEVLSKSYPGARRKIAVRCRVCSYRWTPVAHYLRVSKGCPQCNLARRHEQKRLGLATIKMDARALGGQCISTKYQNAHQRLEFVCKRGHRFRLTADKLRSRGRWCTECRIMDKAA